MNSGSRAATSAVLAVTLVLAAALLLAAALAPVVAAGGGSPAGDRPAPPSLDPLGPERHRTDAGFAATGAGDEGDGEEDDEDEGDEEKEDEEEDDEADEDEAEDGGAVEVEFLNCSAVRLAGDVPEVEVGAFAYVPGIDTYVTDVGPFEGTRVVDVEAIWSAPGGLVLDRIQTVGGGEPRLDAENPNLAACQAAIQPDRPTATVAAAERVGDAVAVTFRYVNPNDVALRNAGGGFDGRIVAGEAPVELQPGTHEFTVEWTPESGSDRLTWTVRLGPYGYADDPLMARTRPAAAIGGSGGDETTRTTRTTAPTTRAAATTTAATSSTGDDPSASASGGSGDGSASTTTRASRRTTATTASATATRTTETTASQTAATETTATDTTPTDAATSSGTSDATAADATAANSSSDSSANSGSGPSGESGGAFAAVDSSTAIQGVSFAVAATFGALAFVAWRRRPRRPRWLRRPRRP